MNGRPLVLLALVLLACEGSPGRVEPSKPAAASQQPSRSPTPTVAGSPVEQARRHAATHFGYEESDLRLLRHEQVVWPNAGLGCAWPDQEYDPTPVPGYRIVLGHGSLEHHYHGADGQPPFLCQFLE